MTPAYRHREIEPALASALGSMPAVIVAGMRQSGKTTLLQQEEAVGTRRYVTLDDFAALAAARSDPDAFLQGDEPLTIDEAQRCPELLVSIKRAIDRDRRPGRFLLSGSAQFSLLRQASETLAGRALYLTLRPMTRRERAAARTPPFLRSFFEKPEAPRRPATAAPIQPDEVLLGGLPAVCLGQVKDPLLWFKGYEQTYLERDIRQVLPVEDLISFRNLLHLVALRSGQLVNQSELGRDAHLSAVTAGRYLGGLEASFVVARLAPHLASRTTRLIKTPKMYVCDSGLAAWLCGVESLDAASDEPMRGPLWETYVAQNLAGIIDASWARAQLTFWQVQGRHEVDFVIDVGRECLAIEVKAGSQWGDSDLAGLRAFLQQTPRCVAGVLAYNGTEAVSLGNRLWAIPMSLLLS